MQGENRRPREIMQLQRVSVDVAELYSPPWVTAEAQKFGLKTGVGLHQGRAQAGSVPGGLVQGDLHGPHEGSAQQGVPHEECS